MAQQGASHTASALPMLTAIAVVSAAALHFPTLAWPCRCFALMGMAEQGASRLAFALPMLTATAVASAVAMLNATALESAAASLVGRSAAPSNIFATISPRLLCQKSLRQKSLAACLAVVNGSAAPSRVELCRGARFQGRSAWVQVRAHNQRLLM
jgi:hypothetical protein